MKQALLCALLCACTAVPAAAQWSLPTPLPPAEYGTIIINRTSKQNGIEPVVFSHAVHRSKHTCRVCHFELEFNFKTETTEITEAANKAGRYCGAAGCHDGKTVFGHERPNCERCHAGTRAADKKTAAVLAPLPKNRFGNGVNWVRALDQGLIAPATHLTLPQADLSYDKRLILEAEWHNIPPAIFPHRPHVALLDCNNCHPDIFNIKKKTTKHFTMVRSLKGEFCGVCHLTVAFPMDDCKRCHPKR
jgi:c(7)-type cytochrome triheme protein